MPFWVSYNVLIYGYIRENNIELFDNRYLQIRRLIRKFYQKVNGDYVWQFVGQEVQSQLKHIQPLKHYHNLSGRLVLEYRRPSRHPQLQERDNTVNNELILVARKRVFDIEKRRKQETQEISLTFQGSVKFGAAKISTIRHKQPKVKFLGEMCSSLRAKTVNLELTYGHSHIWITAYDQKQLWDALDSAFLELDKDQDSDYEFAIEINTKLNFYCAIDDCDEPKQ